MFILFTFNCIVFPSSTLYDTRSVFSYIDDLPNLFEYSWGEAPQRFLCDKIATHTKESKGTVAGTTYLDGSFVGMMVLSITPFGEELELFGERHGSDRVSTKMNEEETTYKI